MLDTYIKTLDLVTQRPRFARHIAYKCCKLLDTYHTLWGLGAVAYELGNISSPKITKSINVELGWYLDG